MTFFNRVKNIFEIERFSSPSVSGIKQDVYGVIFLATLESILSKPAQAKLTTRALERNSPNECKVNRAVSYVAMVDHAVELLCDERTSTSDTLAALERLFLANPTSHLPGRKFERKQGRFYPSKLNFYKYVKRLIL